MADDEADITSDDPTVLSTLKKITANKQTVRKSYLHQSWSEMSLASELSGDDALARVQSRVQAYWDRQFSRRLIASLLGVLASNVTGNLGDMVNDISGEAGTAAKFNGEAVIDTALTMGELRKNGMASGWLWQVPADLFNLHCPLFHRFLTPAELGYLRRQGSCGQLCQHDFKSSSLHSSGYYTASM